MNLTNQHIEFIDNYLRNSGVVYADIRFEMVGHVATALEKQEGDFMENFRLYMVGNKKSLLNNNTVFAKQARRRAFKALLKTMVKPGFIAVAALLVIIFKLAIDVYEPETIKDALTVVYLLLLFLMVLLAKFGLKGGYSKFSVVDKLGSALTSTAYILFVLIRPDKLISDTNWLIGYYTLFTVFMLSGIYTYYTLASKYKLLYDGNR